MQFLEIGWRAGGAVTDVCFSFEERAPCTVLRVGAQMPCCQPGWRQSIWSLWLKFPQCWEKQYFWKQNDIIYVRYNVTLFFTKAPIQCGTELGGSEQGRTLHSQIEDGKHIQEIKLWDFLEGNLVRIQAFDVDTSLVSCLASAASASAFPVKSEWRCSLFSHLFQSLPPPPPPQTGG